MPAVNVLAPAKINLFLHIIGRRDDGYHLLQTVFQFIDLYDHISLMPRKDGEIRRCYTLSGVADDNDLVVRAARLLQNEAGVQAGVDINLEKNIPMGAGLGGGSSDAAAVLVALNQLWRVGMSPRRLQSLGLSLGADVPVFVAGRAAWAEGIGERLQPLESLPQPWYALIVPTVHVDTKTVFCHGELTRDSVPIKIRDFAGGVRGNDCEKVVFAQYPEIEQAAKWLGQYAPARMSGTGSAVFAAFESEWDAQQVVSQMPGQWRAYMVKGMNTTPLQQTLSS